MSVKAPVPSIPPPDDRPGWLWVDDDGNVWQDGVLFSPAITTAPVPEPSENVAADILPFFMGPGPVIPQGIPFSWPGPNNLGIAANKATAAADAAAASAIHRPQQKRNFGQLTVNAKVGKIGNAAGGGNTKNDMAEGEANNRECVINVKGQEVCSGVTQVATSTKVSSARKTSTVKSATTSTAKAVPMAKAALLRPFFASTMQTSARKAVHTPSKAAFAMQEIKKKRVVEKRQDAACPLAPAGYYRNDQYVAAAA